MRNRANTRTERPRNQSARNLLVASGLVVLGLHAVFGLRALGEAIQVVRYSGGQRAAIVSNAPSAPPVAKTLDRYSLLDCIEREVYRLVPPDARVYVPRADKSWYEPLTEMLYLRNLLTAQPTEADVTITVVPAPQDSACAGVELLVTPRK